jgi:hypothetical protein
MVAPLSALRASRQARFLSCLSSCVVPSTLIFATLSALGSFNLRARVIPYARGTRGALDQPERASTCVPARGQACASRSAAVWCRAASGTSSV